MPADAGCLELEESLLLAPTLASWWLVPYLSWGCVWHREEQDPSLTPLSWCC